MYFESLEAILKVLAEVRIFSISRKQKKERIFNAVEAIRSAANRTKFYYSSLEDEVERPNIDLTDAWMKAATAVRELDPNLYERLLMKAEFWANPASWTEEQNERNNILLESILEDTDKILKKLY